MDDLLVSMSLSELKDYGKVAVVQKRTFVEMLGTEGEVALCTLRSPPNFAHHDRILIRPCQHLPGSIV